MISEVLVVTEFVGLCWDKQSDCSMEHSIV